MESNMMQLTVAMISLYFLFILVPALPMIKVIISKEDAEPLYMDLDFSFNPRYMAELFEKQMRGDGINFTQVVVGNKLRSVDILRNTAYPLLVMSDETLTVTKEVHTDAIIHAPKGISMISDSRAYALKSDESISISGRARVNGWIDSQKDVQIQRDAAVNIVTAKTVMLSKGVRFKRIFAATIGVKPLNDEQENKTGKDIVYAKYHRNVEVSMMYLGDGESIEAGSVVHSDVICRGDLKIEKGCKIFGSIKTNGTLEIDSDTYIYGNIFTDRDLLIQRHCFVFGNIFSHAHIKIGNDNQIGKYSLPKSIIGIKGVEIGVGTFIHHYILTYGEGKIV